jgi:hypothetical protein
MTIAKLKAITVDAFPTSQRRGWLFAELERLHADLIGVGAICELWVDGSFLTAKPEPDDIDLCFSAFDFDFKKLEQAAQQDIWLNLNGGKQYSQHLDTYLCFRFLSEDPRAKADGTNDWSEKWGIGWDDHLTGFAVLQLGETNVGLKLLA